MAAATRIRDLPVAPPPDRRRIADIPVVVLLCALAVVALRLPSVASWPAKDEAGFLAVAQQWRPGGTSLYGNYWVDRPPLLITIFRVAAELGGTVPLRLIGIGAGVIAVLAVAWAAGTLGGRRAADWAAVTAAAFLVTPLSGAREVNGELLAAPFVAVGIAALVEALTCRSLRRSALAATLAGACAPAAVLVKQNMLDVFVFGLVLVLLTARDLDHGRLRAVLLGFPSGALLSLGTVAAWTVAHGTSLTGVWFAMYRFRVEAAAVLAAHPGADLAGLRRTLLADSVLTGMALCVAVLVVSMATARRDHRSSSPRSRVGRAVPFALAATVAYDLASIWLGGNFWLRYLVQLAVPLALATGLAAGRRPWLGRGAAVVAALSGLAALAAIGLNPNAPGSNLIGESVGAAARPGDTIVTVWGHADVTRASGLTSPYPYLWYLPERTLDPQLRLLVSTLGGPRAPTWFVARTGTGLQGVDTGGLKTVLHQRYRVVTRLGRARVYLLDGVRRPTPALPASTH